MNGQAPQLCIGTAQFGLAYGITNQTGQVAEAEVRAILKHAALSGICRLDTAQAYGDAEAVVGRTIPTGHVFSLVSKLSAQSQTSFGEEDIAAWELSFQQTLGRLCCTQIDAFLLHAPADLSKPGSPHLARWLLNLKERGLVRRLGVSIYKASDLIGVAAEFRSLVQLPLSLYDQRLLLDGTIERLESEGVSIHARSLFLQGLLLSEVQDWPKWLQGEVRAHHQRLQELANERNCSLLDLALGFARHQEGLEAVVLGVCSVAELKQLLRAWRNENPWQAGEWGSWATDNLTLLDPRLWPR